MSDDRRSFLKKTCLMGFCFYGLGSLTNPAPAVGAGKADEIKKESIHSKWITSLLLGLKDESPETARRIIKNRSEAHFDDLNLKKTLAPYVGDLESFHGFLTKEWGWVIDYDQAGQVVHVDENKGNCVCPLIQNKTMEGLGMLCYCSEGIAEKMFSYVAGRKAKAEVVQSILRGAKTCKYKITLST
jgi:hypothetical protein